VVRRSGSVTHAGGLDYDHLQGVLNLAAPVRIQLPPAAQRKARG